MATAKVKTATNGICTDLVAKAKAYRLANITARMTSAGTGSLSDYKLNAKKVKIESDDSSVVWGFASRTAGDDLEIVATAPTDRGSVVSVWGVVTKDGLIGKEEASARVSTTDITDTSTLTTFKTNMSHLGTHW